jgi:DNA-binding NarL/FixJ family response regulator
MRLANQRASVLIVGDSALHRAAVKGAMVEIVDVAEARSADDARRVLEASSNDGLVTISLSGDNDLQQLSGSSVFATNVATHWLVISETVDTALLGRMVDLGAQCLPWPVEPRCLLAFARRVAIARETAALQAIARKVRELARRHSLTETETDLIAGALRGMSGKEYVAATGLSPNTYKMRVRSALRKLGACSLGEVRDGVLRSLSAGPDR